MCCRVVGAVFVFGGDVAIGITLAIRYRKRVFELCQLEHSLTFISGELKYRHLILADVFGQAAKHCGQVFVQWFIALEHALRKSNASSVREIWFSSLQQLSKSSHLRSSDLLILDSLGGTLGVVALDTQINELAIVTKQLHDIREKAEHELAGRMKLVITLCSVIALLLIILLF